MFMITRILWEFYHGHMNKDLPYNGPINECLLPGFQTIVVS